jgi:hemoglobin/transferrin/lactoferrin receptor protein
MAPAALTALSADEVALVQTASSLPDLLSAVPGVMVQKTARGFGSPYLRGFTGYRTLILVDGVRLNNTTFRDGPNPYAGTIDLFDVERLVVERGPGSVLHGSDAVGGTVLVVPRLARPGDTGRGAWQALYRGSTAEASSAAHLSAETGGERWAATGGGTLRHLGDLRAGSGTGLQQGTGYDEAGWNGNASVDLGATTRLTLAAQQFWQRGVPRWHRTTASTGWHGTAPGTDLSNRFDEQRLLAYARLTAEPGLPALEGLRITASYQRQAEENDRVSGSAARTVQGFSVGAVGLDLQLDAAAGPHRVTYGAEGYLEGVSSFRRNYAASGDLTSVGIQGPVGDDGRAWSLGLYLQDRWQLLPSLALVAGLRHESAAAGADRVQDPVTGAATSVSASWSALVGELRAIYEVAAGLRLYGALSQGFRTPSLSDLTTFDLAEQGQVEVPSPGLQPEHYLSAELGLKGAGPRWAGQLAIFQTTIRDMVDRYFSGQTVTLPGGQVASVVEKANVSRGEVYGLEAEGTVRPHPLLLVGGSFTWTRGAAETTVVEGGVARLEWYPLSRVAPPTAALRLRLGPPARWVEAELRWAGRQDRLSLKDTQDTTRIPPGGTPGSTVVSVRSALEVRPGLELVLVARNVGDVDYRIHGSGISEAGFGLEVAARYTGGR